MNQPVLHCPDRKALFTWAVEQALDPAANVALVVPTRPYLVEALRELRFIFALAHLDALIQPQCDNIQLGHGGRISLYTYRDQPHWIGTNFTDAAVHGSALIPAADTDAVVQSLRLRKPKNLGGVLVAYAD